MIKYILILLISISNLYSAPNDSAKPFQDKINNKNKPSQECNFNQQLGNKSCSDAKKSIIKRIPPSKHNYKRSTTTSLSSKE